MTHVDDRGMGRSFGPGDSRAAHSRAHHARNVRSGGRTDQATPPVSHSHRATHGAVKKKPNRSHSAVGAAIVAGAAMVATFAFILTNGNSTPPTGEGSLPPAVVPESSAPQAPAQEPSANPAPAASTAKADRKPPPPKPVAKPTTEAAPNTGKDSPTFEPGQWIAVLDTYPTDAGLPADHLAKELAGKLIKAGVPARAMLTDGQYPGIANSRQKPIADTWMVYIGPASSAADALTVCQAPKTQQAYDSPACPTYEPATRG